MTLSINDFESFHQTIHKRAPFNWQSDLLRTIVKERMWPRVLDLPTGSGKTTCIDIALFAMALDACAPPAQRWCPRRIAMVVDRRVVVDQAAERGRKLLDALTTATEPAVIDVRDALASLTCRNDEPLGVFTLRGGIPKDDGWTRTPDQPLVIASTVDQLGSRLLIQGYGVTRGMRPVHAGLVGNDMLILLDEVHLSQPFKQTLERLSTLRKRFEKNGLPGRFQFAFLSATPGEVIETRYPDTPEIIEGDPKLAPRLFAKKPARIFEVSGREEMAARVGDESKNLVQRHNVVAAVVNRLDTAIAVFRRLKNLHKDDVDVVLLTGRMRPLDRDDVLAACRPRIMTGMRTRGAGEHKLVVVATQCIEAGADFDFDAMVTESASFDALRQRFGRVDRLGEYKDEEGNSKAEGVIIHDGAAEVEKRDKAGKPVRKDGQVVMVKGDPIYADTIVKTVEWLKNPPNKDKDRKGKKNRKPKEPVGGAVATVDFGTRSLIDCPSDLLAPKQNAPTLLPAYLDLWSQTAPEPFVVPEPSLFLHGPRSGPEDVQVIWRADVEEAALGTHALPNLVATVGAVRPSSLEAVSLPFVAAQRWLAKKSNAIEGIADLEVGGDRKQEVSSGGRNALCWRGDESEIVDASGVRPGDTLIVPSTYGGIDPASKCFNPEATAEVPDLGERASLLGRGRPLLRLHPRVLAGLELDLDSEDPKVARRELAARADRLNGWKRPWSQAIAKGRKAFSVPWGDAERDGRLVIYGERVKVKTLRTALELPGFDGGSTEEGVESTTDDEDSSYVSAEVTLDDHTRHVEGYARGYATRLGLSDELINDLSLAAWLHDIGKADRRFQRMLRGGSEIAYYRDENRILAKSGMSAGSKAERQRAQRLSGYPFGTRHEVQSLAMIESIRGQIAEAAHDVDLVMHLVASHHGHCRPFAPPIEDVEPVDVVLPEFNISTFGTLALGATTSANGLHRLDSPLADRFWSLVAKYGWLELCWLEAIFRLADHRASEDEAGGQN